MHCFEELAALSKIAAYDNVSQLPNGAESNPSWVALAIEEAVESTVPNIEEDRIAWFLTMLDARPDLLTIEINASSVCEALREAVTMAIFMDLEQVDWTVDPRTPGSSLGL